jgi:hypothetical protein
MARKIRLFNALVGLKISNGMMVECEGDRQTTQKSECIDDFAKNLNSKHSARFDSTLAICFPSDISVYQDILAPAISVPATVSGPCLGFILLSIVSVCFIFRYCGSRTSAWHCLYEVFHSQTSVHHS